MPSRRVFSMTINASVFDIGDNESNFQMLAFSHKNDKQRDLNQRTKEQVPFQPLIFYHETKQNRSKSPGKKVLMKTVSGKPISASTNKIRKPEVNKESLESRQKQWFQGGKIEGLFDTKLRKNQLLEAERRMNKKSFKVSAPQQHNHFENRQYVVEEVQKKRNTVQLKSKKSNFGSQEEHLKKLIQREKEQKLKNDKLYQEQRLKLEKQKMELKMIEKQISKIAAPFKNTPSTQIQHTRVENKPPTHDSPNYKQKHQQDTTQLNKEQRLLQLLTKKQRLSDYNHPLNYTPTLIPLLSKASYKIISTHISTITQLLIEDLLYENVLILQEIEQKQQKHRKAQRQMRVVNDYIELVGGLVRETDQIEHRLGRYDRVQLPNWYKPHLFKPLQKIPDIYQPPTSQQLQVEIPQDRVKSIYRSLKQFQGYIKYKDQYEEQNEKMFDQATGEIIQELVEKLVQELDRGAGDFVDVIFRNEFR